MFGFRRKKDESTVDDIALEKNVDKNFRRLDKLYVITACVLVLAWAVWNFSGVKFSKIDFGFISDYFSEIRDVRNTSRVIHNSSIVVNGDYILYFNYGSNEPYIIKKDGSGNKKISSSDVLFPKINGDFIYYTEIGKGIMRMKLDGSEQTLIIEAPNQDSLMNFKIFGNYIYYEAIPGMLSRASLDGKEISPFKEVINGDYYVYGNWVYEANILNKTVFRFKFDDNERQVMFDFKERAYYLSVYKNWAYYIEGQGDLLRCRLDGSELTKIDSGVNSYVIEGESIYYTKYYDVPDTNGVINPPTMIRASLDGINKTEPIKDEGYFGYVSDGIAYHSDSITGERSFYDIENKEYIPIPEINYELLVHDLSERKGDYENIEMIKAPFNSFSMYKTKESIYYINPGKQCISRYNLKTGDTVNISEELVENFAISGNLIVYKKHKDKSMYLFDIKNGKIEKLLNNTFDFLIPARDGVYAYGFTNKLYKIDFKDNSINKVSSSIFINPQVFGDYLYYITLNQRELKRIELASGNTESITTLDGVYEYSVADGYVYYLKNEQTNDFSVGSLYRQRLGSKETEVVLNRFGYGYSIMGDKIIYRDQSDMQNGGPYTKICNLDGSNPKTIDINYDFILDGDTVYILNYTGTITKGNLKDYIK